MWFSANFISLCKSITWPWLRFRTFPLVISAFQSFIYSSNRLRRIPVTSDLVSLLNIFGSSTKLLLFRSDFISFFVTDDASNNQPSAFYAASMRFLDSFCNFRRKIIALVQHGAEKLCLAVRKHLVCISIGQRLDETAILFFRFIVN